MHLLSIIDMGSQWGTPDFKRRWWSNGGKNQNPQEIPEPIINPPPPPIFLESIKWYNMKNKLQIEWLYLRLGNAGTTTSLQGRVVRSWVKVTQG